MKQVLIAIGIALFVALAACPNATYAAAVVGPSTRPHLVDNEQAAPAPVLAVDPTWAGALVIGIVSLFFAAACIGPIIRSEIPGDDNPQKKSRPRHF